MRDQKTNNLDRSLVAPTREIVKLERRLFLQQGLSLGALTLLSGCDITDADSVQKVLWNMSRWNDRVQAAIFDPGKLARRMGTLTREQLADVKAALCDLLEL